MSGTKDDDQVTGDVGRRKRLSQSDVPSRSVKEALRVPIVLRDQYGKQATRPFMVAKAMEMSPTGSTFRAVSGAAVAYGLTDGAAQSDSVALTPLGRRAIAPTEEGDDIAALREAVMQPRVVREFLQKYDSNRVPTTTIAKNVLEDMGVPVEASTRALEMIIDNAEAVGFLQEISGNRYVNLQSPTPVAANPVEPVNEEDSKCEGATDILHQKIAEAGQEAAVPSTPAPIQAANDLATNKRVFVSHGKNAAIVGQLKELLSFGGFDPVVAAENETVSKPVPDKVMDDMRSCGAGIVHVGAEEKFVDSAGNEVTRLNQNVLIEIGAAMALFGRNFILLVENGAQLPSNLQGLYEVRYDGEKLDYEATIKLLRAFNDFRSSSAKE
ncbi:TIR domain-containing protein [uncultured Amnibacterium sp.]|uniref:TIR domain-containing protein n=1 Tax=uncultured Amnibacterium sp. TaxID=1631851 RepID=UPI0035CC00BC